MRPPEKQPSILGRQVALWCAAVLGFTLASDRRSAFAQEMPPDHGGATSAPLFVADLPVGTVSVRITRPGMSEPLAGAEVVGTWTPENGKKSTATVKTGADGRAIFSNVPAGSTFSAKAEVEGETLTTEEFEVPDQGGTKLLMIVGSGAAEAMAGMTGAPGPGHGMGAGKARAVRGGKLETSERLPGGTVEIKVTGPDGQPLSGAKVELAHAKGSEVVVKHAESDRAGIARFTDLESKGDHPWLAVVEHGGARVASAPFVLDPKRGATGELRIPGKTSDRAVLRVSDNSRFMLEPREDSFAFLQNLIIENTSDKIFDPGPGGLLVPLPDGCVGAERLGGGAELEMKETGAILRGQLPPTDGPIAATHVRVGCVIATHGTPEVEIVQPMPLGLQGGVAMVPAIASVALSSPGIRARPAERADNGAELRSYALDSLPPGQPLRLTVYGLPTRSQTGKWIALALAGLLIGAGIAAVMKPRRGPRSDHG